MQLIIKKSFIIIFVIIFFFLNQNKLFSSSKALGIDDFGIISIMYHRFEENKYPSTNIRMDDFNKHLEIIENERMIFVNPNDF